jgi:hypothetical protein
MTQKSDETRKNRLTTRNLRRTVILQTLSLFMSLKLKKSRINELNIEISQIFSMLRYYNKSRDIIMNVMIL